MLFHKIYSMLIVLIIFQINLAAMLVFLINLYEWEYFSF